MMSFRNSIRRSSSGTNPIIRLFKGCVSDANHNSKRKDADDDRGRRRVGFEFGFNNADYSDRVLHIEIMDDSLNKVVKVKTLHINSLLFAGNSSFFHKLLKNDSRESKQKDATLTISASDEVGVMEVLNFMYTNTLKASTTIDLLGVLIVADKYEASDCVRYCSELLQKKPISLESSLLYLKLPSRVSTCEEVQPLITAARKFLLSNYKDIINKSQTELMGLPVSAIEILFSSDNLVPPGDLTGDDVFEFILKYARAKYPELNERRVILTESLAQLIPFRHMSSSKMKEALVCVDLDHGQVSRCMAEALVRVADEPNWKTTHESSKYPVVKVELQSGTCRHRCVVYFDMKKEDCKNLFPSSHLISQSFRLGGRSFYLSARCFPKGLERAFGLFLCITKGSQSCSAEYEFEVMKKSCLKFEKRYQKLSVQHSNLLNGYGFQNLLNMQWTDFMSEGCDFFIDGVLHLRVDLTIKD